MKVLFCGILAAAALLVQGTVTIHGTVTDGSGSIIPGTAVTITQVGTGQVRRVESNERGDYVAAQLAIGAYTVTAERKGFKAFSLLL